MSETRRGVRFQVYLITDRHLAEPLGGLVAVTEAALAGMAEAGPPGAAAVQLREKDLPARDLFELARALQPVCARFAAPLLINDRLDVALAVGADGVHLPSSSFEIADAGTLLGPGRLIGVSAHRADEVETAASKGANFAVFGPVFEPVSKAAYGPPRGLAALAGAVKAAGTMPLFGLGGLTVERIQELAELTADDRPAGIALIGAVFGAPTPGAAARDVMRAVKGLAAT
jgi:thiamine-phosphate pyrophosphorylase